MINEVKVYYLSDEELARYRALPMPPGAKEAARRQHRQRKGADDMPKVLSGETHQLVDEMIRRGKGPTAIVRAAGVSTGTVYYRAAKLGTPRFDYGAKQWIPSAALHQTLPSRSTRSPSGMPRSIRAKAWPGVSACIPSPKVLNASDMVSVASEITGVVIPYSAIAWRSRPGGSGVIETSWMPRA